MGLGPIHHRHQRFRVGATHAGAGSSAPACSLNCASLMPIAKIGAGFAMVWRSRKAGRQRTR